MLFLYNIPLELEESITKIIYIISTDIIVNSIYYNNNIMIYIECNKEEEESIIYYCKSLNINYNKDNNYNSKDKDNNINNNNINYNKDNNYNSKDKYNNINNIIKYYKNRDIVYKYIKQLYNRIKYGNISEDKILDIEISNILEKEMKRNMNNIDNNLLYQKDRRKWREIRRRIKEEEGLI